MKKEEVKIIDGEEYILKYKEKTMLDQFFILLGIITTILLFTIAFDIFWEPSVFGLWFSKGEHDQISQFATGKIGVLITENETAQNYAGTWFDDEVLNFKSFAPVTILFTLLLIGAAAVLIVLLVYYGKRYYLLFKQYFDKYKELKEEKRETEAPEETPIIPASKQPEKIKKVFKKKKVQEKDETKDVSDAVIISAEEPSEVKKENSKEEPTDNKFGFTEEELNNMLKGNAPK